MKSKMFAAPDGKIVTQVPLLELSIHRELTEQEQRVAESTGIRNAKAVALISNVMGDAPESDWDSALQSAMERSVDLCRAFLFVADHLEMEVIH